MMNLFKIVNMRALEQNILHPNKSLYTLFKSLLFYHFKIEAIDNRLSIYTNDVKSNRLLFDGRTRFSYKIVCFNSFYVIWVYVLYIWFRNINYVNCIEWPVVPFNGMYSSYNKNQQRRGWEFDVFQAICNWYRSFSIEYFN